MGSRHGSGRGQTMRLYFITPDGDRLAIDTDRREYCSGAAVPDHHRFIRLEGPLDITIIQSELDFNGWGYGDTWTNETPRTEAEARLDPFYRPPKRPETEGRP